MGVEKPADINRAFADAFNSRDPDAFLALYAVDGMVVNPDGSVAAGHADIAMHIDQLLQLGGTMTSTNEYAFINGDVVGHHGKGGHRLLLGLFRGGSALGYL